MRIAHCSSPPISLPAEGERADIALASSQAICVSSNQYIATGVMHNKGRGCFGDTHCPKLAEPALVPGPDRAAGGAALPDAHQEGSAISSEQFGVAPEPGVVESSCLDASEISELSVRHSHVLDMLSEVRTPSTCML